MRDAPAWQKKIAPAVTRDKSTHRRMFILSETNDDIFESCHTFILKVEDRNGNVLEKNTPRPSEVLPANPDGGKIKSMCGPVPTARR